MALVVTIGGTARTSLVTVESGTVTITRRLGARATCSLVTDDRAVSGAYRPAIDDAVTVTDGSTTLFGGLVVSTSEKPSWNLRGIVTTIEATDYLRYADARVVTQTYASGQTLREVVADLVTTYLDGFGVTLDAGMASGPTLGEIKASYRKLSDVFADLATITGWTYWIDPMKVLYWQAGSSGSAAPYSLTDADANHRVETMTIEQTRTDYANTVYVRYGTGEAYLEESHTADGVSRDYVLDVPCATVVPNTVTVSGTTYPVGIYGTDDMPWTFEASSNTVKQRASDTIVPNGTTVTIGYYGAYPAIVSDTEATEVAAHGTYEMTVDSPDTFDKATAEDIAEGLIRRYAKTPPRVLRFDTEETGANPGDLLTVDLASRGISSETFLVTEVEDRYEDGYLWVATVTAVEGTERTTEWDDLYRQWGGQATSASVITAGSTGVATTSGTAVYFLGATDLGGVQDATPTWTAPSGLEIELDGTALSGALATVKVMVRALNTGVSVQARLYDVTHASAVGTGTAKTSTSWTSDSFTVALAAGTARYRLELLPGTANEDVYAVGYLEVTR